MNSPAPTSSTSDNASSATTSAERSRPVARLSPPRAPSLSVARRSGREARSAGRTPKTSPVPIDSAAVKATTVASGATRSPRGRFGSERQHAVGQRRCPAPGRGRRRRPPVNRLSVSSWRTSRPRDAPSAARTAISRCRADARASSRLAMLAQAISRTKRDGARQQPQIPADEPHRHLVKRLEPAPTSPHSCRDTRARVRAATCCSSARACSNDTSARNAADDHRVPAASLLS